MHDVLLHHPHDERAAGRGNARRLMVVAVLTGVFMLVEIIGGVIADSLALLSDAGHMFVDFSGLIVAVLAARLAAKPPNPRRTFGYRRAEVLGAFVNGAVLCGLVIFIVWESIKRLIEPPRVQGTLMLWIAAGGLIFNVVAAAILLGGGAKRDQDINLRGALLNVFSDAIGSVGAIVAALLILWKGWMLADAVTGLIVAALISVNALRLLRETLGILLQSVPEHLNVEEITQAVAGIAGIRAVHDPHVWAMAPGDETLTLHVELENDEALRRWDAILVEINDVLAERFNLRHNIIQPELKVSMHPEIKHL